MDNTVSAHCRNGGGNCVAIQGEQSIALERVRDAATAGAMAVMTVETLEEEKQRAIEEALARCADLARTNVLLQFKNKNYYQGEVPSAEECNQLVKDKKGNRVKLSLLLGTEMHEDALKCAEAGLEKEMPGRFSREPRYLYDRQTGRRRWIPPEEVSALERTGNLGELKGTIVPDIVIHTGDPLQAQAVYDYKFPCGDNERIVGWSRYSDGPHRGSNQGEVYKEALGPPPARIQPRTGIFK
jgi:hypothetical protein